MSHHQKRNRRPRRRGSAVEVLRDHERPDPHAAVAGREGHGSGLPRNRRGGTEPQAGAEIEVSDATVLRLAEGAPVHAGALFFFFFSATLPVIDPVCASSEALQRWRPEG